VTLERINTIRSMDDDAVSRAYGRQMARFQSGYDTSARRAHAAAPSATRVLDAATGPALLLPALASLYPEATLTALDISPHMIERARETLCAAGVEGRVQLVHGSVYELPFEHGQFDLVIASQLIHMLDDLPGFLREARRVLAPGGTLMLFDFRRDVPAWYRLVANASTSVLHALRVPMDGMGPVIRAAYTPAELESALRGCGFEDITIESGIAALTVEAR